MNIYTHICLWIGLCVLEGGWWWG